MKYFIIILIALLLFNCKTKVESGVDNSFDIKNTSTDRKDSKIEKEFFIGKKFYEGDELINYSYEKGGYVTKDSLTTFSIYINESELIYSLEQQISNEDVKEYKIKNILTFKKNSIDYLIFNEYPLVNNILIKNKISSSLYKIDFKDFLIKKYD